MKGTIIVCGHGPGISAAVARRFGREGYPVAIVARNAERLDAAAAALIAEGIDAKGFACDLGDADAVRRLIADVRASMGPIGVVHWNAYQGGAGDLATASAGELHTVYGVAVVGLVTAVQAAQADLEQAGGAVLVTGGGLNAYDAGVDKLAVGWGAAGLAIAKAAQHKTAGLLHQALAGKGVYVGEVVVMGSVKGTAFDSGHATLEAATIAQRFWELYTARAPASVGIS